MKRAFFVRFAILVVTLAISATASPLASAAGGGPNSVAATPAGGTASGAVLKYWTPERMANAKPATPVVPGAGAGTTEPPVRGGPSSTYTVPGTVGRNSRTAAGASRGKRSRRGVRISHAVSVPRPYTNLPDRTNGKVFFTKTFGGDFVCSATAVNSQNKSLVWTAGHCVHNGAQGGGFHQNWVFVPAYSSTCCPPNRPYGTWTARILGTTSGWASNSNLRLDVGAVVVNLRNAQRLVNVVGGQGTKFGSPRQQAYSAFGYPGAAPFNGLAQFRCNSSFLANDFPPGSGPPTMKIHCNMNPGASGGGWLTSIASNGLGFVTSVNSYINSSQPDRVFGPYQLTAAQTLFNDLRSQ